MKIKSDSEIFEEREYERKFGDDPNPKLDRLKNFGFVQDADGHWYQQIGDEFYKLEDSYLTELFNEEKK